MTQHGMTTHSGRHEGTLGISVVLTWSVAPRSSFLKGQQQLLVALFLACRRVACAMTELGIGSRPFSQTKAVTVARWWRPRRFVILLIVPNDLERNGNSPGALVVCASKE